MKFLDNSVKIPLIVDCQRHTYLGSGDHVNCRLMFLEYLKHLLEESVRKQHPARFDLDCSDVVLCSDSLDISSPQHIVDQRSRSVRLHGVKQPYRNIVKFCGLNTCGMQNLGTEISQLGSLFEMEVSHRARTLYKTRIIIVHSVYICPYLYLLSLYRRTDKRCCIIAASAFKIIDLSVVVKTDETLRYKQSCISILLNQ